MFGELLAVICIFLCQLVINIVANARIGIPFKPLPPKYAMVVFPATAWLYQKAEGKSWLYKKMAPGKARQAGAIRDNTAKRLSFVGGCSLPCISAHYSVASDDSEESLPKGT